MNVILFGFANSSVHPSYRSAAAWELKILQSCFPANNDLDRTRFLTPENLSCD